MQDLKVNLVQLDIIWEDSEANLKKLDGIMDDIHGSDLIILPEMFNTGFSMNPQHVAQPEKGDAVQWLIQRSAVMATTIVASVAIEEHGNYFNRCYVASYGKIIARYDKRNCFTLAHEDKFYQSGDQHIVFQIKEWKIKPLICYDLRFPLWCYNHEDADILLFVANWPESRISHWDALLQARAIENQAFVIGVNRVGLDGNNDRYNGHSSVITPYGNYQLGPLAESGVFGTQIDREEIVRYRKMFNLLAEERAKSGNDTK